MFGNHGHGTYRTIRWTIYSWLYKRTKLRDNQQIRWNQQDHQRMKHMKGFVLTLWNMHRIKDGFLKTKLSQVAISEGTVHDKHFTSFLGHSLPFPVMGWDNVKLFLYVVIPRTPLALHDWWKLFWRRPNGCGACLSGLGLSHFDLSQKANGELGTKTLGIVPRHFSHTPHCYSLRNMKTASSSNASAVCFHLV